MYLRLIGILAIGAGLILPAAGSAQTITSYYFNPVTGVTYSYAAPSSGVVTSYYSPSGYTTYSPSYYYSTPYYYPQQYSGYYGSYYGSYYTPRWVSPNYYGYYGVRPWRWRY